MNSIVSLYFICSFISYHFQALILLLMLEFYRKLAVQFDSLILVFNIVGGLVGHAFGLFKHVLLPLGILFNLFLHVFYCCPQILVAFLIVLRAGIRFGGRQEYLVIVFHFDAFLLFLGLPFALVVEFVESVSE